jgi:hypothetical protein
LELPEVSVDQLNGPQCNIRVVDVCFIKQDCDKCVE